MARQNNAAYWAQRMKNMEDALKDQSYSYVENMEAQFRAAQAEIEKDIARWYQRFADNNEISLAEAKRLLNSSELEEFRWTVGEYIAYGQQNALDGRWMKQLENASARVHVSRLDAMKLQMQQQAEMLYSNQLDFIDESARAMYANSYYHTAYELQKGVGVGWSMQSINEQTIQKVLSRPWTNDNQTFRDRCWTNKQSLVNSVNTNLTQMIIRGEAPDRAIAAVSKQFDVSRAKAGRLIMTESAYFASAAQKDCYSELGVEKYRIVETFDGDTCELCAALDGTVFKMSEYQVGLTAPPFHPWCRGCTCPHFDDMEGIGERWTRNADGTTSKIPANTSYSDWKKQYIQKPDLPPVSSGGTIDAEQRAFSDVMRAQVGITEDYAVALEERYAQGTDAGKSAFNKYVSSSSVADGAYKQTPHFDPRTGAIRMNYSDDLLNVRGVGSTYFHEHGHYIDYAIGSGGYASVKNPAFFSALKNDFNGYISETMKANNVGISGAYGLISKELQGDQTHAISDLLRGMSGGSISGKWGHYAKYWKPKGSYAKEAFAHMFEAQFNADKYAIMKKYFPEALTEFERMLNEVIK